MLKKLVSRSTSALESFANRTPVAREIINSLNNIVNNTNQRVGQFSTIKTQILDGIRRDKKLPFQKSIDSEVNQKLFDILFRGDVAVTDDSTILQAAQRIRESLLNPIHKMLVDAGSNMGYEENYLPAVIKNFGLGPGRKNRRQDFINILSGKLLGLS